ncbi:MAG: GGDEF domain-containing protein, partial [Ruminococcus sp.]|nr:GGDEF domain-containing protein [Ruminococcus sp.]
MAEKTIGIFIPQIHKSGHQDYLNQLSVYAREAGYSTMCFTSYSDLYRGDNFDIGEQSIYDLAKNVRFSAMVVYNELIKNDEINDMLISHGHELGIPVFTLDRKAEGSYLISYDYGSSFEQIVDHVIEHHDCKNICMMSGHRGNPFSDTREEAYRKSLEKHGIAFDEAKIYYGEFWDRPTIESTKKLLDDCGDTLPDAIVCANDAMAIAVCNELERNGVRVPYDVIITGSDGIDRSRTFFPTISTARPDFETSTRYIMDTIIAIDGGAPIEPCEKYFGFKLCDGQSCGCEKITGSSSGLSNSALYEQLAFRQSYTAVNDRMVLRNNDGRDIVNVLENIKKYFCEVLYAGIELYLDPRYFGSPNDLECPRVLAAHLSPEPHPNKNPEDYSVPFTPVPEDRLCSEDILTNNGSVLFVPVHCQEKVYGYVVAEYRYSDSFGGERLYDFITHLNFLFSSIENTAKLHEVIEQLNALYVRDQLTDLLNRHGFYRELEKLTKKARKEGKSLTFISADLDGLKYINDNFGHSEGDFAIVAIANILTDTTGRGGVCARFGGDEYLAACISEQTPEQLAEHFSAALADINAKANKPYQINASFGIEIASP